MGMNRCELPTEKKEDDGPVSAEGLNLSWMCVNMHVEAGRAAPLRWETLSCCPSEEAFHKTCSVQPVLADPVPSPSVSELSIFCAFGQVLFG